MLFNANSVAATALILFASVSMCSAREYSAFEISSGVGGAALAEAKAQFPIAGASLTGDALGTVNTEANCAVRAEQAYIDAIAEAGADSAQGKALKVGMTKNKVLKIFATIQANDGFIAQQGASAARTAQAAELNNKLNVNVAIDEKNKGQLSAAASFTC